LVDRFYVAPPGDVKEAGTSTQQSDCLTISDRASKLNYVKTMKISNNLLQMR